MKGKYRIIVENKKIRYDFEIKRNITIIKVIVQPERQRLLI